MTAAARHFVPIFFNCYIKEENNNRIVVFKIEEKIAELLEYRKISFDIIWWNYTGLKLSNSCILEENINGNESKNENEIRKHLLMKMKDEIIKIDPLIGMIENDDQFVSMIFVNEFHNPNVLN